ncbi:MAG: tRNA (guanosine(37)-N1)-methyltransferase TrmD [Anaerolineaceae bacterium]
MRFDVFTLFPSVFKPYLEASILQKAQENQLIHINLHNIRDWAPDKHHVTDDTPYGGGGGMVMKAPPIFEAVESTLGVPLKCPLILLSPQGKPFSSEIARDLAKLPQIGLLCGRYEGIDERVRTHLITDQISIGDYVLTGGELPALILIDAISRFIPGVLGDPEGAEDDSFASGLLEYPQFTKPEDFRGWHVPDVLLSGNHAKIQQWRKQQSLIRTRQQRPDLLSNYQLSDSDKKFLKKFEENGEHE